MPSEESPRRLLKAPPKPFKTAPPSACESHMSILQEIEQKLSASIICDTWCSLLSLLASCDRPSNIEVAPRKCASKPIPQPSPNLSSYKSMSHKVARTGGRKVISLGICVAAASICKPSL